MRKNLLGHESCSERIRRFSSIYPVLPSYKREIEWEELFPLLLSPSALLVRQWDRRGHTGLIPVCGSRVTLAGCIFN